MDRTEKDLNRNPFDDVPRDCLLAPVVETRRARVGVAGQALHVLQWHALFEQVDNRVMRKEFRNSRERQAGVLQSALSMRQKSTTWQCPGLPVPCHVLPNTKPVFWA